MKWTRRVAYMLGCVTLASSFAIRYHLGWMGFPDGHLTDFERIAETILLRVFGAVSLPIGVWFLVLGWIGRRHRIGWAVCLTAVLFAILVGSLIAVGVFQSGHLEDGTGG